jgi:hypothetical protein
MEHALDILGTHRGSLSAGSLPGRDRAYLLYPSEEMSERSRRPRFNGLNAQLRESALEGIVDAGRRLREAAAITPVIAVSGSDFADRAHGLVAGLDPLARAA